MTTASFNACQPECRAAGTQRPAEVSETACETDCSQIRHAREIQRMKEFAGRRRFQAPLADDFARGMLAVGQDRNESAEPRVHVRGALESVMVGFESLVQWARG